MSGSGFGSRIKWKVGPSLVTYASFSGSGVELRYEMKGGTAVAIGSGPRARDQRFR